MLDSCLQAGGDRWANEYGCRVRYGKDHIFKLGHSWMSRLAFVSCPGSLKSVGVHLLVQKP